MKRFKSGDKVNVSGFAGTWIYSGPCIGQKLRGFHVVMLWSTGRLERVRLTDIALSRGAQ